MRWGGISKYHDSLVELFWGTSTNTVALDQRLGPRITPETPTVDVLSPGPVDWFLTKRTALVWTTTKHVWLVVWLPFFLNCPIYWEFLIIPIDVHIFQRGGPTTNQMCVLRLWATPKFRIYTCTFCQLSSFPSDSGDGASAGDGRQSINISHHEISWDAIGMVDETSVETSCPLCENFMAIKDSGDDLNLP